MKSIYLRLLLTILYIARVSAVNLNPSSDNLSFDPAKNESISCTIPPYADKNNSFQPEEGMCQTQSTPLTIEDAQAMALEYAPHLFFHPLEQYTLTDVNDVLVPDAGQVYLKGKTLEVVDEQINQTTLLNSTRDFLLTMNSNNYFFSQDVGGIDELYNHDYFNPPGALGGSGYDGNGKANAPIYYRVFDSGNGTWTFNYWFYYAFNGQANMGVLSSVNGTEEYIPFIIRPFGQHEADWEAVSVQVCQSLTPSQPLAISYRQHGWNQITNCLEGDCTFYKETFRPVGFVALNSHATYPISTRNMVYTTVEVPFIVNLQGVVVVDRTEFQDSDGKYKEFSPNSTNVLRYQDMSEIVLGETDESLYWQGFGGSWGDITKPSIEPQEPQCLTLDQLNVTDCPTEEENSIFHLVMVFLGVREPGGSNNFIFEIAGKGGELVKSLTGTGSAPGGPPRKSYWNAWSGSSNAPLWDMIDSNTTAEDYCARLIDIVDTSRLDVELSTFDLYGNIIGILIFIFSLWFFTLLFYIFPRVMGKKILPVLSYNEKGEIFKPDRTSWFKLFAPTLWFTVTYFVAVAGLVMFGRAYDDLLDLMNQLVGGDIWEFIVTTIEVLGIFVLVVDTMLCLLMWIASTVLWRKALMTYYDMTGDDENLEKEKNKFFAKRFGAYHTTFLLFFSLLLLSLMIATLVVLLGVGLIGFSYAFTSYCNDSLGSIGEFCLDLGFIGIERIACGADFQEFCRDWGKTSRATILWGGFILMAAHFYFIAAAGESYHSQITVYPALDAMVSPQNYKASSRQTDEIASSKEGREQVRSIIGFGNESHRQNPTKAAVRACRNAMEFNAKFTEKLSDSGDDALKLHVMLGVPAKYHEKLDLSQVATVFPCQDVQFTVQDGGLVAPSGRMVQSPTYTDSDDMILVCAVIHKED